MPSTFARTAQKLVLAVSVPAAALVLGSACSETVPAIPRVILDSQIRRGTTTQAACQIPTQAWLQIGNFGGVGTGPRPVDDGAEESVLLIPAPTKIIQVKLVATNTPERPTATPNPTSTPIPSSTSDRVQTSFVQGCPEYQTPEEIAWSSSPRGYALYSLGQLVDMSPFYAIVENPGIWATSLDGITAQIMSDRLRDVSISPNGNLLFAVTEGTDGVQAVRLNLLNGETKRIPFSPTPSLFTASKWLPNGQIQFQSILEPKMGVGDVTETITEPVRECGPNVAAIWTKQLQPVLEIQERLFPTSIWINHDLHLAGLKMVASGNRISLVGDLKLDVAIDLRQGALGARMTVKGALKCDSELTLKLDADVNVTPDAALDVKIANVNLDWRKACIPGAVEAFDAVSLLNPTLLLGSRVLGDGLNSLLRKELNRTIQEGAADDLNFRDDLIRVTPRIREAQPIGELLWLEINPSKMSTNFDLIVLKEE